MDFVTTKENLLRELDVMQGIVEKKSTIPILSNIVIDAGKDRLELLATDLEVGIRTSCEAKITRPGSITMSSAGSIRVSVRRAPAERRRILRMAMMAFPKPSTSGSIRQGTGKTSCCPAPRASVLPA